LSQRFIAKASPCRDFQMCGNAVEKPAPSGGTIFRLVAQVR
jgi:hypothetical protein